MKILLVAATRPEIQPILQFLSENYSQINPSEFHNNQSSINVLITGVGMVATAFQLGKTLSTTKFDLVINAGIAGAINRDLMLGDVVQVVEDQFYNFGAEDKNGALISVFDLGLIKENEFPFHSGRLTNEHIHKEIKVAKGITVQKVHGAKHSIQALNPDKYDVESMEGAAFLYSVLLEKIKCYQIRSISNYVEERNRENWKIGLAIKSLNAKLIELFF